MCQRDSSKQSADKPDKAKPKVSESRKIRKPLMEKKRRARINDCLNELKNMLLDADPEFKQQNGSSSSRPAKLEKADILELTVCHLRRLRTQHQDATEFKSGFSECAGAARGKLARLRQEALQERLGSHLGACLAQLDEVSSSSSPSPPPTTAGPLTLVPTKLANGDLAFVIPASMVPPLCPAEPLWRPW